MILVKLKGGLGNQMFQYALGRVLAIRNNDQLKLDISDLTKIGSIKDTYRPYALEAFNIKGQIATPEDIQRIKYPLGSISKIIQLAQRKILRQKHESWEPGVLEKKGDVYLDGYWQSPKYFENIRDTIISDFSLSKPFSLSAAEISKKIAVVNAVSVHIRRGDYITNPYANKAHGTCSVAYYEKAIKIIDQTVKNPTYFVFSDGIEWVKEHIHFPDSTFFVSNPNISDTEELLLMSQCKHNIIANSSFSWWGAWLNKNRDKIVIAPTPWFNTNTHKHNHLIPTTWIQLPRN